MSGFLVCTEVPLTKPFYTWDCGLDVLTDTGRSRTTLVFSRLFASCVSRILLNDKQGFYATYPDLASFPSWYIQPIPRLWACIRTLFRKGRPLIHRHSKEWIAWNSILSIFPRGCIKALQHSLDGSSVYRSNYTLSGAQQLSPLPRTAKLSTLQTEFRRHARLTSPQNYIQVQSN